MICCRLCNSSRLTKFLDLGFTPLADRFLTKDELNKPETCYPLTVVKCDECSFVQLSYVVPPEILYQNDYPYETSVTRTACMHFNDFARSVVENLRLKKGDLAIDIGSNVGVLLSGFKKYGLKVLGVDPASNIAKIAQERGIPTIANFFSINAAEHIIKTQGKAKVITGSNVFAHIDNLTSLMKAVDCVLEGDGVFIIEVPYLGHLLNNLEYDTIYHEHLSYISITPLAPFFQRCGFEIFDIQQFKIHGGSVRIYIGRKGARGISKSVLQIITYEQSHHIHSTDTLKDFALRVERNRDELVWFLKSIKRQGKKVAGISAPAKGMTLLNYCKIGTETLDFLTEKSKLKIGKYSPGGHIPIMDDSYLAKENIDYALLLAWNFKDEIMRNLVEFKKRGGRFIIPIPELTVV